MNYFNSVAEIEALVSRLIDKLDASRTESLELSIGDVHLKLDRHGAPAPTSEAPAASAPAEQLEAPAEAVKPKTSASIAPVTINAPLLGVAYAAPAPGAEPFVQVGQSIKKGDIICIIEAMKVMNEIEADRDGVVTEILFENGKMVEFSQPLVAVK